MDREYQQLRFDISEKVRLHPQQPGIKSLVELNLYPDVEIEDQETHLRIHGYLKLAGKYVGDEEEQMDEGEEADGGEEAVAQEWREGESIDEIAFVIPVEITLPSDRVAIDRLAAEVESFDYQVLSPFELQIEAVLAIDGLLPDPKKEEGDSSDSLVSFAGSSAFSEKGSGLDAEEEESSDEVHLIYVESDAEMPQEMEEPEERDAEIHVLSEESSRVHDEDGGGTVGRSEKEGSYPFAAESSAAGESPAEEWFPDSSSSDDLAFGKDADETAEKADREENRKDREDIEPNSQRNRVGFGLSSKVEDQNANFQLARELLRKPSPDEFGSERAAADSSVEEETRANKAGELKEEPAESTDEAVFADAQEDEQEVDKGERLHWTRQFLGAKEETFVKMRMVIVQKDESLDSLADRYGVAPNQILRLNDLDSGELEEGQIVYIPGEERQTTQ